MGSFKENRRSAIESGKEKGDSALARGEQRLGELESVKRLIDSISLEDDEDMELAESLNESYLEAGKSAHQEEVESVVESARGELKENKGEIAAERSRVESAREKVQEMQSATDLAQSSARSVESALERSAGEYSDMEQQTDQIEEQLESSSQEILGRIESLFG